MKSLTKTTIHCEVNKGAGIGEAKEDACIMALQEQANVTFFYNDVKHRVVYNDLISQVQVEPPK